MTVLPSAILLLEALVVALAIPVAISGSGQGGTAGWVLGLVALALLVASGLARRPLGVTIGWVLQGAVLATGLLVPAMFALGLVFLAVWITALVYGAKADRFAARSRLTEPGAGPPSPPPASSAGSGAVPTDG